MDETLPLTEAKAHLSEVVDRVVRERARVYITRNGKPAAVVISPDELESIEETLEIMSDKQLMKSIRKAIKELDEGKSIRLEDIYPREDYV